MTSNIHMRAYHFLIQFQFTFNQRELNKSDGTQRICDFELLFFIMGKNISVPFCRHSCAISSPMKSSPYIAHIYGVSLTVLWTWLKAKRRTCRKYTFLSTCHSITKWRLIWNNIWITLGKIFTGWTDLLRSKNDNSSRSFA